MKNTILSKYRTISPRIGARLLDEIILCPLYLIAKGITVPHPKSSLLCYLMFSLIAISYVVIGHHKFGQTLGKKLAGVRVVQRTDESKLLSLSQAVRRNSLPILGVVFVVALALLGELSFLQLWNQGSENKSTYILAPFLILVVKLIVMKLSPKRRSIEDYLGGSVSLTTESSHVPITEPGARLGAVS